MSHGRPPLEDVCKHFEKLQKLMDMDKKHFIKSVISILLSFLFHTYFLFHCFYLSLHFSSYNSPLRYSLFSSYSNSIFCQYFYYSLFSCNSKILLSLSVFPFTFSI